MNIKFNWAAAFALAAICSFASMPAFAQSIFVRAEVGSAEMPGFVPLDGVWEFEDSCSAPDAEDPPEEQFDQREYLIYGDNTVGVRLVLYTSNDGSCTGDETVLTEAYPLRVVGDFQSQGWGGGGMEMPPLCQDPTACPVNAERLYEGRLKSAPIVTEVQYVLTPDETEIEIDRLYIDDTGDTWYLYRHAGKDDAPSVYLSSEEPRVKVDIVFEATPECEIELSQEIYVDGDTIMANVFRLSNPTADRVALEVKVWLGKPDGSVKSIVNIGAYGFFRVPAETDIDLGPLWLGTVWPHKPRGEYELSCRVLEPKTGKRIAEDINHFVIE